MIAYSFHPDADADLEEAIQFYEDRMRGLGRLFRAEIERTVFLIRQFPDAGMPEVLGCRRVVVARFPYSLVYRQALDGILVVAVARQRRRPGYWRTRG